MTRLVSDDFLAAMNIWMEARGESYDGKIGVAEVMHQRMLTRYMSDGTLVGTVLRPYQFSGWNTTDPNRIAALCLDDTDPLVQECLRAWHDVLGGASVVPGAVLYYNDSVIHTPPAWALPEKLVGRVGAHVFFRA